MAPTSRPSTQDAPPQQEAKSSKGAVPSTPPYGDWVGAVRRLYVQLGPSFARAVLQLCDPQLGQAALPDPPNACGSHRRAFHRSPHSLPEGSAHCMHANFASSWIHPVGARIIRLPWLADDVSICIVVTIDGALSVVSVASFSGVGTYILCYLKNLGSTDTQ